MINRRAARFIPDAGMQGRNVKRNSRRLRCFPKNTRCSAGNTAEAVSKMVLRKEEQHG